MFAVEGGLVGNERFYLWARARGARSKSDIRESELAGGFGSAVELMTGTGIGYTLFSRITRISCRQESG